MRVTLLLDAYPDTLAFALPLQDELVRRGLYVNVVIARPAYERNAHLAPVIVSHFPAAALEDVHSEAEVDALLDGHLVINLLKADVPLALDAWENHAASGMVRIFRGLGDGVFYRGRHETILGDIGFVFDEASRAASHPFEDRLHVVGSLKAQHFRSLPPLPRRDLLTLALDNVPNVAPVNAVFDDAFAAIRSAEFHGMSIRKRHHIGSTDAEIAAIDAAVRFRFDEVSSDPVEDDMRTCSRWVCFAGSATAMEATLFGTPVAVLPMPGRMSGPYPELRCAEDLAAFVRDCGPRMPSPEPVDTAALICDVIEERWGR